MRICAGIVGSHVKRRENKFGISVALFVYLYSNVLLKSKYPFFRLGVLVSIPCHDASILFGYGRVGFQVLSHEGSVYRLLARK